MILPNRRPARKSLTAGAMRIEQQTSGYAKRLEMPWQSRALYYTDSIGELSYASNFYARMLQRVRIFPAFQNEDGVVEEIKEGLPVEIVNRVQDPGGGRTALLGMYGKLMFITGEGYLFGRGIGEGRETWQFVWREELKFDQEGKVTHVLAPNIPYETFNLADMANFEPLPEGSAAAYRMWTPHPRFSSWPNSPMRAILDEAEELLILSRAVHATATSRLVRAPLLLMPEEIAPAPPVAGGDEDPETDPFLVDFAEHMMRAIEDPASAEALSPYVLYAHAEWLKEIRPVVLHDTQTDYMERDLRLETLRRIARGLDLPPEVVEGMSDANHWAAWWISDDMWRSHGAPKAEQFCDDFGDAYVRPALRDADFERAEEVIVGYDASAVVVNPDRSKDADQAWDRGAIGYAAYRNAKNFKEEDAQTEEEHIEWLATKKVAVDENGDIVPAQDATNPGDEPGPPAGEPGDESESAGTPRVAASANGTEAARFRGAAELALFRCRELAGSRIRSRRKSCPHCLEDVEHVANSLVASVLGRAGLEPLGAPDPRVLVAGGGDSFRSLLTSWGYDERTINMLAGALELHAARTLFLASPALPDTFAVLE